MTGPPHTAAVADVALPTAEAVRRHYDGEAASGETPADAGRPRGPHGEDRGGSPDLLARVEAWLGGFGDGPLTAAQLADLDQFHVGGLAATEALAALAGVPRGADVLDAGAGLGGPSRVLAERYDCRVVGVDLVPAYVAAARRLAERTGCADRVRYEVGDLRRLPFADGAFDLVWTQHVAMNVGDRAALYRELRRVLRPDGALAFYDVLAADGHPALHFPVPWAEDPATSALLTDAETRAVLQAVGFAERAWRDVTADAAAALPAALPAARPAGPPPRPPALAVVLGPRFATMAANLARNVREARVRLVMGVYDVAGG